MQPGTRGGNNLPKEWRIYSYPHPKYYQVQDFVEALESHLYSAACVESALLNYRGEPFRDQK